MSFKVVFHKFNTEKKKISVRWYIHVFVVKAYINIECNYKKWNKKIFLNFLFYFFKRIHLIEKKNFSSKIIKILIYNHNKEVFFF